MSLSSSPPSSDLGTGGSGSGSGNSGLSGSQRQQRQPRPPPVTSYARRPASRRRGQASSGGRAVGSIHSSHADFRRLEPARSTASGSGGESKAVLSSSLQSIHAGRRTSARAVRHGHTSIGFRRSSVDSFSEGSCRSLDQQSEDDDGEESAMEVMDLRPRGRVTGRRESDQTNGSSLVSLGLVSLGSLSSMDSGAYENARSSLKLSGARFVVEHGAIDEHGGTGGMFRTASGGDVAKAGEDAPSHWDSSDRSGEKGGGRGGGGEPDLSAIRRMSSAGSEALHAIVSRIGGGGGDDGAGDEASRRPRTRKRDSLVSVNFNRSGILTCFAAKDLGDAGNMSEASESVGANSSVWTESSPLTADGSNVGRKRRMIGRTCARALAGLVVVAALSGSVIVYLIPQEERRIVLEGLLGIDVVGRLLGVTQESKMGVIN